MGLLWKHKTRPRRERHVLKLIHPGGFVEQHGNPIMASQVMNKNPRHCVTRPDFFQFPWIVVSPESILTPGNVFYIVPCHTIRHLLKSTNTSLNHNESSPHSGNYLSSRDCKLKIPNSNNIPCFQKQSSLSTSTSCVILPGEGRKHSKGCNTNTNRVQPCFSGKPVYCSDYTSRDSGKVNAWTRTCRFSHSEQIPKLKPCLKKDKNRNARSPNLKVRFVCNDHELNKANFTTSVHRHS